MDNITIVLTTPEAIMFRDFQEFHEAFATLVKAGVFDTKYGNVQINFMDGKIMSIAKNETVWKR